MKRVLQLMRMTLNRIGNQLIIIVLQMLQIRKTEMRNIKLSMFILVMVKIVLVG